MCLAAPTQAVLESDRLQRHGQLDPQAIRAAVEMQGAVATLNDRLDNRKAEAATGALAVAPEALGQVLQVIRRNPRPVVAHDKTYTVANGFQTQLNRTVLGV